MIEHIENEAKELVRWILARSSEPITIQGKDRNIFDISVMNVMFTFLRGERYELDDERIILLMEAIHKTFQIIDMSGGGQ